MNIKYRSGPTFLIETIRKWALYSRKERDGFATLFKSWRRKLAGLLEKQANLSKKIEP